MAAGSVTTNVSFLVKYRISRFWSAILSNSALAKAWVGLLEDETRVAMAWWLQGLLGCPEVELPCTWEA